MNVSRLAEDMAGAYRRKMIEVTEKGGHPQVARQWQKPWDQTDVEYRKVWESLVLQFVPMPKEEEAPVVNPLAPAPAPTGETSDEQAKALAGTTEKVKPAASKTSKAGK